MAQEERYGTRNRSYSAWHRRLSTRRFVGIESAQLLAMIDLDASLYVEYDDGSKEPVALVETALDVGQSFKTATVTRKLSIRSGIPAYVVLYREAATKNPADPRWNDIESFRVMQIGPGAPEQQWRTLTPGQWCEELISIRKESAAVLDANAIISSTDPTEILF